MKELLNLLAAWDQLAPEEEAILATVVATQGSTYRKTGARMLMNRQGWLAGSVSGGCLEADLIETAWQRTETGPALAQFDAQGEEDILWGYGLGCNGSVTVLLERRSSAEPAIEFLRERIATQTPDVLITCISPGNQLGAKSSNRKITKSSNHQITKSPNALETIDTSAQQFQQPGTVHHEGNDYLIEPIAPPPSILVFGAGNDAIPLVELCKFMGWRVELADIPSRATQKKFPSADQIIPDRPEEAAKRLTAFPDAAVLMTHRYLADKEILRALLPAKIEYIGLLGPRARAERMLRELEKEGVPLSAQTKSHVYAPIGLGLGAQGPSEIALSIVAQIQAFLHGRSLPFVEGA